MRLSSHQVEPEKVRGKGKKVEVTPVSGKGAAAEKTRVTVKPVESGKGSSKGDSKGSKGSKGGKGDKGEKTSKVSVCALSEVGLKRTLDGSGCMQQITAQIRVLCRS